MVTLPNPSSPDNYQSDTTKGHSPLIRTPTQHAFICLLFLVTLSFSPASAKAMTADQLLLAMEEQLYGESAVIELAMTVANPRGERRMEMISSSVGRDKSFIKITYPTKAEEQKILKKMATTHPDTDVEPVIQAQDIADLRDLADEIYLDDKIEG